MEEEPSLLADPQPERKPVQKARKKPNKQRDFFDFKAAVSSGGEVEEVEESDDSVDLLLKKRKMKRSVFEEDEDEEIVEVERNGAKNVFKEIGLDLEDEHFSGTISAASKAKLIEAE